MTIPHLLAGAALGAGLLTGGVPHPPDVRPTLLVLAVTDQGTGETRTAELTCDPPAGTHPRAAPACRDLAAAGGDFTRLPGDPVNQVCALIYQPVTATAHGLWRASTASFQRDYPNACVLGVMTGPVFAF